MRSLRFAAVAVLAGCAPSADNNMMDNVDAALVDDAADAANAADAALGNAANALASVDASMASDRGSGGWSYTQDSDPMTDEKTELACVDSSNMISLSAPYDETGARLCLRNSPQFGKDAYVSLHRDGQILCRSYESCTIRIRFDKSPAEGWSALGPSDGSSDMVFIQNRASFERQLRASKTTHVQLEFYQNGMQTFTFSTAGLKWGR